MIKALLLLLCCGIHGKQPADGPICVDVLEINHVHRGNDAGRSFTQIILWKQFETIGGPQLRPVGWYMVTPDMGRDCIPIKGPGKLYTAYLNRAVRVQGKDGVARPVDVMVCIQAPVRKESWTMHDVEREGNKLWGGFAPNVFDAFDKLPEEENPFLLPGETEK